MFLAPLAVWEIRHNTRNNTPNGGRFVDSQGGFTAFILQAVSWIGGGDIATFCFKEG